jgi:hypothetical protein
MQRQRCVLQLEALEDRCLPSSWIHLDSPGQAPVAAVHLSAVHHAQTGIRGVAQVGPIVPVERPGVPNTRPLANALIEVRSVASGSILAEMRTDQHGRFTIPLAAGTYELVPLPPQPGAFLPRGMPQMVAVTAHGFTSVIVNYDSGIR